MSRPVMYKSKPVNTICKIECYPTVMYKMRSIYDSIDLPTSAQMEESNDGSLVIENLNKDCNSQIRRLNRLQDKLNQFCEDISLSHLISVEKKIETKKNSEVKQPELFPNRVSVKKDTKKKAVDDIVINVSSGTMPYGILVAFSKLATKYKCFMQFFIHGSAMKQSNSKIGALKELFHKLKLDLADARSSYDYGVNLIWKKLTDEKLGSVLILNSTTKIYGESNIIRFLHRLCNTNPSLDRDLDIMDQCTNELLIKQQQNTYLTYLNNLLTKSSRRYLTFGEEAGSADFYVWSVLKQQKNKIDEKKFGKVVEWMKIVEASLPMAQMISSF